MLKVSTTLQKRTSMWKEACKLESDTLFLQETHFHDHKTPCCSHKSYPHILLASAPEKKKGVLLAMQISLSFELKESILDRRVASLFYCAFSTLSLTLWWTFMSPILISFASSRRYSRRHCHYVSVAWSLEGTSTLWLILCWILHPRAPSPVQNWVPFYMRLNYTTYDDASMVGKGLYVFL